MTQTITLPGLIDPHVHLRDPGQTEKEDFFTGTSAALAGGFTTILDMPNNLEPITTLERLENKIQLAQAKTVCDIGFHFGTLGDNFDEFPKVMDKVKGLKIYLNVTTGNFIIDKSKLLDIYKAWASPKPILLHAEEDVSDLVRHSLTVTKQRTHICHVSSQKELEFVIDAKEAGLPITCGVTPHHLFLTQEDAERLGAYAHMKPYLKSKPDQEFIWSHLDYVDVVESDHAPHTRAEKAAPNPPFGVPGLETTLPLLLTAEAQGRLSRRQLIEKLHTNPASIFDVNVDPGIAVEVSLEEYVVDNDKLLTKAGWSPFADQPLIGKVKKVAKGEQILFAEGRVLASPGSGQVI